MVQCSHEILLCEELDSNCKDPRNCNKNVHVTSDCPKDQKVPVEELEWLRSQRLKLGERAGMQMAGVDRSATKKFDKYMKNKAAAAEAERKRKRKYEEEQLDLQERKEAEAMELELEELGEGEQDCFKPPKLTKKEEEEAKHIVDRMLEQRLGKHSQLVTRFLEWDIGKCQRNYMPIPSTAAESLR